MHTKLKICTENVIQMYLFIKYALYFIGTSKTWNGSSSSEIIFRFFYKFFLKRSRFFLNVKIFTYKIPRVEKYAFFINKICKNAF